MSPRPESIKKAIEVLGDFNPSEDKIKKTLGIGDDEIRLIQEEKSFNTSTPKPLPMNKKETKKAQSTLGINLSKEKLMDVLGVDEDTITEAQTEEVEHQERQIKRIRDQIIVSNKRALKKALEKMGCNPSSSKIMKTLGVSEAELPAGTTSSSLGSKEYQENFQQLLISFEITVFMIIVYAICNYYF